MGLPPEPYVYSWEWKSRVYEHISILRSHTYKPSVVVRTHTSTTQEIERGLCSRRRSLRRTDDRPLVGLNSGRLICKMPGQTFTHSLFCSLSICMTVCSHPLQGPEAYMSGGVGNAEDRCEGVSHGTTAADHYFPKEVQTNARPVAL
ncbi:hypothetical protein CBL_12438 [Carabus blaptoides fortunei]